MSDAPKRRRWFQIHLSTLVVVTLVAAVLVWSNLFQRHPSTTRINKTFQVTYSEFGWPRAVVLKEELKHEPDSMKSKIWFLKTDGSIASSIQNSSTLLLVGMNSATALAILAFTAVASEWLLRRRPQQAQREEQ